jgi:hypothetical protein
MLESPNEKAPMNGAGELLEKVPPAAAHDLASQFGRGGAEGDVERV